MNLDFQLGDRVSCNEYQDADWQVVKINGGHATIELLEVHHVHQLKQQKLPQRRRVPFWQLKKLDNKPQWSDWYWGDNGIFRHRYSDWRIKAVHFPAVERRETAREEQTGTRSGLSRSATAEECSDCAYLEKHLEQLQRLKQELIDRAAQAKGSRKREFERGIKSKKGQIEYVSQRLQSLTEEKEMAEVEVIPAEELTKGEQRELKQLEEEIEQSFVRAGRALAVIRDKKLYRENWATFADYVRERFGFNRTRAYHLIDASAVVQNLTEKCLQFVDILPTNESQCRELNKLKEPELQAEAWVETVQHQQGKAPPARAVRDVVEQIKDQIRKRANIPCPFLAGEVCRVLVKGSPELRGLAGAWAIVKEVREFTIIIEVWKGEFAVKEENLKSLEFNPDEQQAFREINVRIAAIYPKCTEDAALNALEVLSRLNRPVLTDFEESLLQLLEKEVG